MRLLSGLAAAAALVFSSQAAADPWKDESGHGHHRGEWKQEWREGPCKIERKWEPSGEYKEEVKCHDRRHGHVLAYPPPPVHVPAPVPPSVTIVVPFD